MIQSNYLPWRGYFDFIDDVDQFVIYDDELFAILERRFVTISELNIALIRWVMEKLDIQVPIDFSKRIKSGGDRNQRILNILHELGATEYLTGPKAQAYIDEEGFRQEVSQELEDRADIPAALFAESESH